MQFLVPTCSVRIHFFDILDVEVVEVKNNKRALSFVNTACANQNSCMILSAFSTKSIEDVAKAGGEGL